MISKEQLKDYYTSFDGFYSQYFPDHKNLQNGEWLVVCPFHDDHKPSMNINVKTGLFNCHACDAQGDFIDFYCRKTGKNFSDAVNDLGTQAGLQPQKPKIVKTYDYLDLQGNLVCQTVRLEPKDFRQRIKKNGQWIWSLKGVETVLYNLPAIDKAKQVLVLEGEKDCDNAVALGYDATTSPMGAGKWYERYSKSLYGKEIILIPDCDQVGMDHMITIGRLLKDKATVKWFEYPGATQKGYDFSDLIGSYPNDFEAMKGIDSLIRSARLFNESNIIVPVPDTQESEQIKTWITACPGEFSVKDLDYDLGIKESKDRMGRTKILEKFVAEKILSREGKRRGVYRPYKKELVTMDYTRSNDNFLPIWLPMGIHKMVGTLPGNIIILAGDPNAGKTAVMLNIIKNNMHKFNVHYFNSEMGAGELKGRLQKFDGMELDNWKFNAYSRDRDFADVIFKGENSLNIIDFLEVHEDFYLVGEKIKQIHSVLDGGIAIIAIQKNKGADMAVGGNRTMEKARLVLNIEPGKFKITKAKNFVKPDFNPNGAMCEWKLVNGCQFIMQSSDWYKQ